MHDGAVTEFAAILNAPGVREICELRGRVGFMAYHGGNLELMTDVIASAAARNSTNRLRCAKRLAADVGAPAPAVNPSQRHSAPDRLTRRWP